MKVLVRSVIVYTVLIVISDDIIMTASSAANTGETLLRLLHAVEDALDEISVTCEIPMPVTKFVALCRQIEKIIRKIKFKRKVLPKIRYLCEKLDIMVSDIKKRIHMGEISSKFLSSVEETTKYRPYEHRKGTIGYVRSRLRQNMAFQPRAFGVFYTTKMYD